MKEVIIMLKQIISSHQLAANIKNKVRYTPTKETSGHAGFINAINKSIDDYIFEDDKYMVEGNKPSAKDQKQQLFLKTGIISFPVGIFNKIYLRPEKDSYYQKFKMRYEKDITKAGWLFSYSQDEPATRPQTIVHLLVYK